MATGKAIIYKGIPYFSDVAVPTRSDLELDTIRLTNQTTTGQGLINTNLNYDGRWISAKVADGYYASFRPSAANKLVIRLVDDNGNAANSKTVTIILYHLGTIN